MGADTTRVPRVKVIVLNFNGGSHVVDCLRQVEAVDWPRAHLDVLVVDNGSTDGSAERIAEQFPTVRLMRLPDNIGYAAGNNVGLRESDHSEYIALLNNDAFVEEGWLRPLVETLERDPKIGAATSKILLVRDNVSFDVVNNAGNIVYADGYGADRGIGERDEGQYDSQAEVFAWCGCSVLLSRAYLESVGMFDEDLFAYYEDIDLSWRGRKAGWRYVYVPSSVVHHLHTATSVEGTAFFDHHVERNRLIVMTRNGPPAFVAHVIWRTLRTIAALVLSDVIMPVVRLRKPRLRRVTRRIVSFSAFAVRVPRIIGDRRRLRRRPGFVDDEVSKWLVSP